jgi:hypothetical protein
MYMYIKSIGHFKIQQTITIDNNKLLNRKIYDILVSKARLGPHSHSAVPPPFLSLYSQTGKAWGNYPPLPSSSRNCSSANHLEHRSQIWRFFPNLLHQYYGKKTRHSILKCIESNENICIFT